MSNLPYHRDPKRVSKSALDLIARSPRHYWHKYINPDFVWESDETPALVLGKAIHGAILEPDRFEVMFAVKPDIDRRTKEGKAAYADWEAANEGKTIITVDQYDTALFMRDSAYKHTASAYLLNLPGVSEQVTEWTDETTGAACKCRTDRRTYDGWVLDIKSTTDASPEGFGKSSWNYRYDVQSAFYTDGLTTAGHDIQGFAFIAIEKEPPYAVAVYFSDETVNRIGRERYLTDLNTWLECKRNNDWPAYGDKAQALVLPGWATRNYQQ